MKFIMKKKLLFQGPHVLRFPDIYGPSAPISTSRVEKVPLCPAAE